MDPARIAELTRLLGANAVVTDTPSLRRRNRTTDAVPGAEIATIVRPSHRDQVIQLMAWAASAGVDVHPISTGKNWGYGDACPPKPQSVLLDLSRLNRILEVHSELAYAVVEPGVTQGQLAAHLRERGIALTVDGSGAGPDASLIGNTLQRGFGHSPYGDRYLHSCAYEAVLPGGRVLATGFGSFSNAKAAHIYKWGIGPSLDGLFTQHPAAVITRMTVWLMPQTEDFRMLVITLRDDSAIGPLMERLRRLRLQGTLASTIHCFNAGRLLASRTTFPWDQADGTEALEAANPELFQRMCRDRNLPAWALTASVRGSRAEVNAAVRTVWRALRGMPGLDKRVALSERQCRLLARAGRWLGRLMPGFWLVRSVEELRLGMDLLRGRPSYETLKGSHWRARGAPGTDQDALDSGAGLLWISPVLPMTQSAVDEVLALAKPIFHRHGFEFQITLSCINERALCGIMSLCFDRQSAEECARAEKCADSLLQTLLARGYVPYRAAPRLMPMILSYAPELREAHRRLASLWAGDAFDQKS